MNRRQLQLMHGAFVVFWAAMLLPTVLWWKDSVLWVGILSVWALIVGHADGWLVAKEAKDDD